MKQSKQKKINEENNTGEVLEVKTLSDDKKIVLVGIVLFACQLVLPIAAALIYHKTRGEILKLAIFDFIGAMCVSFSYIYSGLKDRLSYNNKMHSCRYMGLYCTFSLVSCLFPLMNHGAWAFVCIALVLMLFSEPFSGLCAVTVMLLDCCLLYSNAVSESFFVYFLSILVCVILFKEVDMELDVTYPLIVSMLVMFLLEIAGFVLLENTELNFEQFIMPLVNVCVNAIVMSFSLKYYNEHIVNTMSNLFARINDQEYSALLNLKDKSKDEYFRSIHTAHLAERMAVAIGCNVDLTKNCAYYHRIKSVYNYTQSQCIRFCRENNFPKEAEAVLMDYYDKREQPVSKEASIVYLADKLIATILKIFGKNKNATVDYNELIDTLFERSFISEALSETDLSGKDIRKIKKIMKEDILYYDFLR